MKTVCFNGTNDFFTDHSLTHPTSSPFIVHQVGMEEDSCQRVVSQLCGALSHLHSLGFVHRDVKPENVFLCDSTCRWVKLGDFGMVSIKQSTVLLN